MVLQLCNAKSLKDIMYVEATGWESKVVMLISLVMLRIFVHVSSASSIPHSQGISLSWVSMLYFTSINISPITKQNVVSAVIPRICLYAQRAVKKMAHTTSEPCEHYCGCCRMKKREFTCSDFVSYVEGLDIALQQMVEDDFCSGGGK
eukprot:13546638-Ditylum_brightwellii.AAC.1